MLVGGQALNYWAETLGIADARSTGIYGPATSEDIDIMGSVKAVRAFAQAVGGKSHIAGLDDSHSPNSGVVTFDFQGETHSIDFLAQMAGFKTLELPGVLKCALTVPLCKTSTTPLSVMHPMHCLQAQLENIYGEMLNRRDSLYGKRYVSRVRLAIEACRRMGSNARRAPVEFWTPQNSLTSSASMSPSVGDRRRWILEITIPHEICHSRTETLGNPVEGAES